jgi:hypothetical protein
MIFVLNSTLTYNYYEMHKRAHYRMKRVSNMLFYCKLKMVKDETNKPYSFGRTLI